MVVLIVVMVKKRRINLFVVKIIELSLQVMHFIDRALGREAAIRN